MNKNITLFNPAFVYSLLWIVVFSFYYNPIVNFYEPVKNLTWIFVGGIILFFIAGGYFKYLFNARRGGLKIEVDNEKLVRFQKRLMQIWLSGFIIEFFLFGGYPILWILLGQDRYYYDFGVPTVHGFLMSFYQVSLSITFCLYLSTSKRKYLISLLLHFMFPIFFMSRGGMIVSYVPLFILYLYYHAHKLKMALLKLGIVFVIIGSLFYFIGLTRGGLENLDDRKDFVRELMDESVADKDWLVPLVPIYIYSTAPLNNINYNLGEFEPDYSFYYSVTSIFPTVIRNFLYDFEKVDYEDKYGLKMSNLSFNTFTMYGGVLKDFGLIGPLLYAFLFGFIAQGFYIRLKLGSLASLICYAVVVIPIFLSPFWDYLSTWLIIAQLITLSFGSRYFEKKVKLT